MEEIIEPPNAPEDNADDIESGTHDTAQSRSSLSQRLRAAKRSAFSCTSNNAVSVPEDSSRTINADADLQNKTGLVVDVKRPVVVDDPVEARQLSSLTPSPHSKASTSPSAKAIVVDMK